MAFPTKMYFSLSEVSARWHRQTKDVEYCIENGLLNAHIKVCSVKLTSNMLLNKFPHNSQEIYEYTGCKRICLNSRLFHLLKKLWLRFLTLKLLFQVRKPPKM